MVPLARGRALAARLEKAGARAEPRPVPGAHHAWHGLPDEMVTRVFARPVR